MSPDTPIDDPSVKLPRPFVRALLAAGLTTLGAAWAKSDEELLALHGVGAKGIRMLRALISSAAAGPRPAGGTGGPSPGRRAA